MQIAPNEKTSSAFENDITKKKTSSEKKECMCDSFSKVLFWCRWFGITPIKKIPHKGEKTFVQEDAGCLIMSYKGYRYLFCGMILSYTFGYIGVYHYESNHCTERCNLIIFIQWIYLTYAILITAFGILNAPIFVKVFNQNTDFLRLGLFCDGSKKLLTRFVIVVCVVGLFQILLQISLKIYMFPIISEIIYNVWMTYIICVPFLFCFFFCSSMIFYVVLLNCFESYLDYVLNGGKSLNRNRKYCNPTYHMSSVSHDDFFSNADFVRRLHESIRLSLMRTNRALNPQILIHLSVEILVTILHLYSVIVYFTSGTKATQQRFIDNFFDVLFIVNHIFFILVFLFCAQAVKSTVSITQHIFKNLISVSNFSLRHIQQDLLLKNLIKVNQGKILETNFVRVKIFLVAAQFHQNPYFRTQKMPLFLSQIQIFFLISD